MVNFAKSSLLLSQRISFLEIIFNSTQMAPGQARKVGYTSTAWKYWQSVKTFRPSCCPGGTPRLNPLEHYDGHVLHKSLHQALLEILNKGVDMLSQNNVSSEDWMFHPQTVSKIQETFRRAEVDLFASKDNCHCSTYFSRDRDVLAHDWPSLLLYTFSPIAPIPQVIR